MLFGKLELDPAISPGVLDTATWDAEAACRSVASNCREWAGLFKAPKGDGSRPLPKGITAASFVQEGGGRAQVLARMDDGQHLFLSKGVPGGRDILGEPIAAFRLGLGSSLHAHPADAPTIDRFCRLLRPSNAPRALGRRPRLGIGTRMTTKIWPGIFRAMDEDGFSANAIQNSVRELNLLSDLKEGKAPERNIAFCFGAIESGYTGSSFEGLWVSGALAALLHGGPLSLGADADHIQLKRSDPGLARALAVVEAARYYSFFTLDPSDLLDYGALRDSRSGDELLGAKVPDEGLRRELLDYHGREIHAGGRSYGLEPDLVGRLVGKYWDAMEGAEILVSRIRELKAGEDFDLEFAYDENPPGLPAADCVSLEEENLFVMREAARRALPVSHIAPNFGVEKGRDYRLPDGLAGLGAKVASAWAMAEDLGFVVDIHSADDLAPPTRRTIGAAGKGALHYKISPSLMILFAECVYEAYPSLFLLWWDDALAYAEREAAGGSSVARECLAALGGDRAPAPGSELFHQFYFAFPGRRDERGRFSNREMLYSLSQAFYGDYQDRVARRIREIAEDIFVV